MRNPALITLVFAVCSSVLALQSVAHEITEDEFDQTELEDLKRKLDDDATSEKEYGNEYKNPEFDDKPREYICGQFARDVQWNLWKAGTTANRVGAKYTRVTNGKEEKDIGHEFLETTLRGKDGEMRTVYIEAQTDKIHTTPLNLVEALKRGTTIRDFTADPQSVPPVQLLVSGPGRINVKDETFTVTVTAFKGKDRRNLVANQRVNIRVTNPDGSTTEIANQTTGPDGTVNIPIPNANHMDPNSIGKNVEVEVTIPGTSESRTTKVRVIRMIGGTGYVPPAPGQDAEQEYVRSDGAGVAGGDLIYSRIAVQTEDECIARTYYFFEVAQEPDEICYPFEIRDEGPFEFVAQTMTDDELGAAEDQGESVPECGKPPLPTVTVTSEDTVPGDASAETPESIPADDGDAPRTTVDESPPEEDEEVPDLGLVKATESVVKLTLTGEGTGDPYEGAAVKLLPDEPPLRLAADDETELTSSEAYANDVATGFSGEDGSLTIAHGQSVGLAPSAAQAGEQPSDREQKVEVRIDERKKARLVVAMTVDQSAGTNADEKTSLPGSLARPGLDLCIAHSFRVGQHAIFITSLAPSGIEEFKRTVAQTEGVYSVEEDRCRQKEGLNVGQ